ncbi:ABC transporter permease [Dactylosporangium sp. CS-033363]|uniref:ABC transporter permease n=1 Tax=Dactylosporangium sp. CS-033363 TaxID=3239935 RepID=UPI003D8F67E8
MTAVPIPAPVAAARLRARPVSVTLATQLLRRPAAVVSLIVLAGLAAMAVLGPSIAPHGAEDQDYVHILAKPVWDGGTWTYPLGTDELGRDLLSRMIVGSRTALGLAFAAALLTGVVGTALGLVAGLYTRFLGPVIMWVVDAQLGFPYLVLALALVAARGPSLTTVFIVLALFGWVQFARVVRAEVLRVKTADYVLAARGAGASELAIVLRHILPNVLSTTIVVGTFTFSAVLLVESGLSFLGAGVQPPTADWGAMMAGGRVFLNTAWWYSVVPGVMVVITVLAVNTLGAAVRSVLNPREAK